MVPALLIMSFNGLSVNAKTAITLKQTVEINRVGSAKISPNGLHIAYSKIVPRNIYQDDDGKPYVELYVTDLQGNSRRFITGKQRLGNLTWGPKSHFIYFIAQRNKDKYVAIYRIAIDGGEAEKIVSAGNNILSYSLNYDGSAITYLTKPKVAESKEKLEKKGFKAKVYEESEKNTFAYLALIDDKKSPHIKLPIKQNILSVQYHPKNNRLLVRTTPTSLIDDHYVASHYRIYQQDGKPLKEFKTEGKLMSAEWSNDGRYVAIIGAEDKNDPAAGRLFIARSKTGKIKETVKNYAGHIRSVKWISDYQVAFLANVGTNSEVSVYNLDNGSVSKKIKPGNEFITTLESDQSGKVLIGVASTDSHPREVFNLSQGKVSRLTQSNNWLKRIEMPKQKSIHYKSRDGLDLQGVLIYPTNYRRGERYPLIMMVHGGPESNISDGWLDRYSYPIKYAASRGFAVFLPNYRGSTGRGVEFSKKGQADYAGGEFNDLVDAIAHLSRIGLVDRKRVGITGASYGGYASAWAATALSKHFAASVMFVGISDQLSKFGTTDIAKEMHDVHARYYPWEKWQWMLERSPIYHTDKAKTPLLIMHGDSDTRVHPSQSMELYRYIKTRTDTPVRLVFYPGEGHGNKKNAAQLDYSIRLMRWMEFYLKGKNKGKKMPPYEINHEKNIKNKS